MWLNGERKKQKLSKRNTHSDFFLARPGFISIASFSSDRIENRLFTIENRLFRSNRKSSRLFRSNRKSPLSLSSSLLASSSARNSGRLKLASPRLKQMSTSNPTVQNPKSRDDTMDIYYFGHEDIWEDDSDSTSNSNSNPENSDMMRREWDRRQNQFNSMGYREGITQGKIDSAQEGFNIGFKQSALIGHKWGLIRGIISAIGSIPESWMIKLVPRIETRQKLFDLIKSVKEISSDDALKIYHQIIIKNKSMQSLDSCDHSEEVFSLKDENNSNKLAELFRDLVVLLNNCPEIKVNFDLKI